jgi:hypothetical protein
MSHQPREQRLRSLYEEDETTHLKKFPTPPPALNSSSKKWRREAREGSGARSLQGLLESPLWPRTPTQSPTGAAMDRN